MCQPLITDFSLRPHGQAAAVAGTVVEDAILFPRRAWAVGPASVTYVTTALDGTDRRTLTWSFEVLPPPPAPNSVRVAWSGADTYRLLWDPPTGSSPVTVSGYVAQGNERDASDNTLRYVRERIPTSSRYFDFSPSWAEVSATAVSGVGESVFTSVPYWGPLRGNERDGGLVLGDTGLPAGEVSALVNLTMTGAETMGCITADRCSNMVRGEQSKSNGNFEGNTEVANLAVVPLDPDGSFCIYSSGSWDVIVDLQGVFSTGGSLGFTPVVPRRIADTREWMGPDWWNDIRFWGWEPGQGPDDLDFEFQSTDVEPGTRSTSGTR